MKPLCVDLDGTLIKEDVALETAKIYIKRNTFNIFKALFWLLSGSAFLKRKLAERVELDVKVFEYNQNLLKFISEKKKEGRKIFLATGCDQIYADKIADYLGVFDGVFASDGDVNLIAKEKARFLVSEFGKRGFIYAGNSTDDIHIWNESLECVLVSPDQKALKKMRGRKYLLID